MVFISVWRLLLDVGSVLLAPLKRNPFVSGVFRVIGPCGLTHGTPIKVNKSVNMADLTLVSSGVSIPSDGERLTSRSQGLSVCKGKLRLIL